MNATEPGTGPSKRGWLARLREGLARTRQGFVERVDALVLGRKQLDPLFFEDLEEVLVEADLGVPTTLALIERIQADLSRDELADGHAVRRALERALRALLEGVERPLDVGAARPFVILVVGVNGTGKTTTIGKLAARYRSEGRRVVLAAADTFRAAAIEQLEAWGVRAGAEVVRQAMGSDASAVAFDAVHAARARGADVVLVDTAGRLHTKVNLMEELKKIVRVLGRELPGAPHETLLVLDATTGQNAIQQARLFTDAVGVTGLAVTKLDGTAKGGVVFAIARELGLPIRYVGVGERPDDLRDFRAAEFVEALFGKVAGAA
ncbi:MAG TPA: signal recognition particle-docking protein FtsY [Thermodesulfobacteriota bacterium]|nr:signal recognition particle-docking protein FtsY [Thermodesulfobacteriota bacterium]